MYKLDEVRANQIADALAEDGYIVLEDLLPQVLVDDLVLRAQHLGTKDYKKASIGRGATQHLNVSIRTDETCWLEGVEASEAGYLAWMDSLRAYMNRYLYLGLFDYECHFAHYGQGDFYKKHLDVLRGSSNRVLTTVFYLNDTWQEGDGGELLLYDEADTKVLETVTPKQGTLAIFLSEKFPHEVLPSHIERYSIAGWFRVNGSTSKVVNTIQ